MLDIKSLIDYVVLPSFKLGKNELAVGIKHYATIPENGLTSFNYNGKTYSKPRKIDIPAKLSDLLICIKVYKQV